MKIESTGLRGGLDLGGGEGKKEIMVYVPSCVQMMVPFATKGKTRRTGFRDKTKSFISLLFFFWPRHMACGILFPQSGIKPGPLAVEA